MNRQQYNQLVSQIESRYQGRPRALLRRALLYVWLSYSYLALVILFSSLSLAALVALVVLKPNLAVVKLGLVLGGIFGALLVSIVRACG